MSRTILALAATLLLAACNTDLERGAAGAVVGAGASAALDGNVAAGAAVGAAAGVFCDDVGICR